MREGDFPLVGAAGTGELFQVRLDSRCGDAREAGLQSGADGRRALRARAGHAGALEAWPLHLLPRQVCSLRAQGRRGRGVPGRASSGRHSDVRAADLGIGERKGPPPEGRRAPARRQDRGGAGGPRPSARAPRPASAPGTVAQLSSPLWPDLSSRMLFRPPTPLLIGVGVRRAR